MRTRSKDRNQRVLTQNWYNPAEKEKKRSGELHLQRRHQIYKVIKHGYFIQLSSLFQMNISGTDSH